MRRALPLLIVAFVALCAIGLWVTRERPEVRPPAQEEAPPPARADQEPPPRERADAGPSPISARPPPSTAIDAGASPRPLTDEEILAMRGPSPAPLLGGKPGPAARPEEAGRIDAEAIKRAIDSVKPLVAQCFEDAEERFPPPQKVTLRFTIVGQGISGHFDEGTISDSTIVDPWVQACFLDALTDARFPVPEGGGRVTVSYPFTFGRTAPDGG